MTDDLTTRIEARLELGLRESASYTSDEVLLRQARAAILARDAVIAEALPLAKALAAPASNWGYGKTADALVVALSRVPQGAADHNGDAPPNAGFRVPEGGRRMSRGQNDRQREFSPFALFVTLAIVAIVLLCAVVVIVHPAVAK